CATLGTPAQIEMDAMSVRLFSSAPVQRELKALEALYEKDPQAQTPSGRITLRAAAASMAMYAIEWAVNRDVDRPAVMWNTNAEHRWGSLTVPRSGIVQDNPDNVYRVIPIDGAASYEITGKINKPRPGQETFVLHEAISGTTGGEVKHNESEAGSLSLDQIKVS